MFSRPRARNNDPWTPQLAEWKEAPMSDARLSTLDASFLEVETPTAHMHVGWASRFESPQDGRECGFEELREHIAGRLGRAPRYRQKLASDPLDLSDPVWVDD